MFLTVEQIEQRLAELGRSIPRLLSENEGAEFWIEFLERADAIKDHVSLDHYDWVTERIYEALAIYGIAAPSRWILATLAEAEQPQIATAKRAASGKFTA
ncbi:hypothetical protein [Dyella sp. 2HG41-7]|uniref:hypothetical protein n=1 Tax=Dyella sp. 2HG41-7 TaxID=2883239 RepID=UPI001F3711CA|nr:hypothetical protein [Dyella sp. 2HG41-7]